MIDAQRTLMRRILLTGDLLRPRTTRFTPAQNGNILWLHRLLRRPLAAATGLPVEALLWDARRGCDLTRPSSPRPAQRRTSRAGSRCSTRRALPREAAALLAAAFADAAAVVGFELPEMLKRLLDAFGLPWVDLNIHPYRFGADVLFAMPPTIPACRGAVPHHAEDAGFGRRPTC